MHPSPATVPKSNRTCCLYCYQTPFQFLYLFGFVAINWFWVDQRVSTIAHLMYYTGLL